MVVVSVWNLQVEKHSHRCGKNEHYIMLINLDKTVCLCCNKNDVCMCS